MKKTFWSLTRKIFPFFRSTYCPVCDAENAGFCPLPEFYEQESMKYGFIHFSSGEMTALDTYLCSHCGASDRERLYACWLGEAFQKGWLARENAMLHFAPESALAASIRKKDYFSSYHTVDMSMEGVDYHADLQSLPFDDEICDFFICSHVLEHVDDDRAAIKELYRITRKGGCGLLMVPVCTAISQTIEDPSITDEGERWRLFGQNDHVRLYSRHDYVKRVAEGGFQVRQLGQDYFGSRMFKQLGLKPTSILYVASKT